MSREAQGGSGRLTVPQSARSFSPRSDADERGVQGFSPGMHMEIQGSTEPMGSFGGLPEATPGGL